MGILSHSKLQYQAVNLLLPLEMKYLVLQANYSFAGAWAHLGDCNYISCWQQQSQCSTAFSDVMAFHFGRSKDCNELTSAFVCYCPPLYVF